MNYLRHFTGKTGIVWAILLLPHVTLADTHYVWPDSPGPTPPYTNWATAATNIQDAINSASSSDLVLVTNGVYATVGRAVYGAMTNRVAITNAVTVQSVNGPSNTVIVGHGPMGKGAVRCAYVGANALLAGFTLTNGCTRTSGDTLQEQSGGGALCDASAVVSNCILVGNSANYTGGGVKNGTLNNSTLSGNSAVSGGGASDAMLNNCTLSGNSAGSGGGGGFFSSLNRCTVSSNSATFRGGGTFACNLTNCMVLYNSAGEQGGGILGWTCNNSVLVGNLAQEGGGAHSATLNNCVIIGNRARFYAGGVFSGTLRNSIVYCNSAPMDPDCSYGTLQYCWTNEPAMVSLTHISSNSPCVGAGSAAYTVGTDVDGETWRNPPSIGCDEVIPGAITGQVTVGIGASYTNVAIGYSIHFTAYTEGRVSANTWDLGDGIMASNRVYVSRSFASPGVYPVILWAYNESYPGGVAATVMVQVAAVSVHYVNAASATPSAPYLSWETAAVTIQDAVDASVAGDTVLVTNGVYATGGRAVYGTMTNRVAITKPLTVRSVDGPGAVVIQGAGPLGNGGVRCVYVGEDAVLLGFTLTNGFTRTSGDVWQEQDGGGAWCEISGVLNNCILFANSAYDRAGGSFCGTLNNCTISGNSAGLAGGGTFFSTVNNCIVYSNSAPTDLNCSGGMVQYTCTPDYSGTGNITNEPEFVNYAAGDLHLLGNSPCINAGDNATTVGATDLDGNPRIIAGQVDMGAYESPYAWINASAGSNGTISPVGRVVVLAGSDQSFAITAEPKYAVINDVKIDGVSVGWTNLYTFSNVSTNHTIQAFFFAYPGTNGYEIEQITPAGSNRMVLRWTGTNGWTYILQQTPTLMPPAWSNVAPYTNITGLGGIQITNSMGTNTVVFYRLIATK